MYEVYVRVLGILRKKLKLFENNSWYKKTPDIMPCDMCYGYIYDTITVPLKIDNILQPYINNKSVKHCGDKLAACFQKAFDGFDNSPYFLYRFTPSNFNPVILDGFAEDAWVWSRFESDYPGPFKELVYAIQIALEHSVGRNTGIKEQLIKHFIMERFRILIKELPGIHKEHVQKIAYVSGGSRGPVPYEKLVVIRLKAGLPPPKYESLMDFNELYS